MSLECLDLRVMDLPIRRRRAVSASNNATKPSSTASACLSNPYELNSGRSCSLERRPTTAAAVQVRSQDGWGLPFNKSKNSQRGQVESKRLNRDRKMRHGKV